MDFRYFLYQNQIWTIFYDQSEGFPRTGYFVPACVEKWAWPGRQSCRRAVAAVVGVISPGARFSK